jgi:hypothetical protein
MDPKYRSTVFPVAIVTGLLPKRPGAKRIVSLHLYELDVMSYGLRSMLQ